LSGTPRWLFSLTRAASRPVDETEERKRTGLSFLVMKTMGRERRKDKANYKLGRIIGLRGGGRSITLFYL